MPHTRHTANHTIPRQHSKGVQNGKKSDMSAMVHCPIMWCTNSKQPAKFSNTAQAITYSHCRQLTSIPQAPTRSTRERALRGSKLYSTHNQPERPIGPTASRKNRNSTPNQSKTVTTIHRAHQYTQKAAPKYSNSVSTNKALRTMIQSTGH